MKPQERQDTSGRPLPRTLGNPPSLASEPPTRGRPPCRKLACERSGWSPDTSPTRLPNVALVGWSADCWHLRSGSFFGLPNHNIADLLISTKNRRQTPTLLLGFSTHGIQIGCAYCSHKSLIRRAVKKSGTVFQAQGSNSPEPLKPTPEPPVLVRNHTFHMSKLNLHRHLSNRNKFVEYNPRRIFQ